MNLYVNLLLNEWIKLKSSMAFILMSALYLLVLPLAFFYFQNSYVEFQGLEIEAGEIFTLTNQNIWYFITYFASYLHYLFVIVILTNTSSDVTSGLWKQHVIDGLDRHHLVTSKLMIMGLVSVIASIFLFVCGTIMIQFIDIAEGDGSQVQVLSIIALYGLQMFGYMMVALLINLFLKSTGISLIFLLAWAILLERVIRFLDKSDITNYLFITAFDTLLTHPFIELFMGYDPFYPTLTAVAVSLAWIGIFAGIAYWKVGKEDL